VPLNRGRARDSEIDQHERPGPGGGAPAGEGRSAAAELEDGLDKTAGRPMTPLAVSAMIWVFILLPLVVIWVIGLIDIVRRPLSRQATAAWIVVVLLLPFMGTLVYFLLRKPTQEELQIQRAAAADVGPADARAGVGPRPPAD
jgi:Phospholipase_D-nuclease N-terminal